MIPSSEEKSMAMLCHLLLILTGFIGPLIIWLIKKDESEFVNKQGKEALNFAITLTIAYVVSGILVIVLIGFLLMFVLWVLALIFGIMASIEAYNGKDWKYPIAIPFIK